jgi:hypothetical protein
VKQRGERKVLTTGRLDGLVIQPFKDALGVLRFLNFTVNTLPGLRVVVETAAARELRDALTMILEEEPATDARPRRRAATRKGS